MLGACSTNALVDKGGACFQSIDCQEGLICIPTPGAAAGGNCSDDPSSIVSLVEAGGDGSMTDAATVDGTTDTSVPDTSPDNNVPDNNIPDNNVPDNNPPPDTGTPDTGGDAPTD